MAVSGPLLGLLAPVRTAALGAVGLHMLRCPRNRGLLFHREGRISAGRALELLRIRTLRRDLGILASTGGTILRGERVAY